ncbi:MAG: glycosyltransferase family 39 protein [Chloroflexaceae bacterium]|nr:glycosyltransferase family 39 protein [Chloroflexaceae bacterium]
MTQSENQPPSVDNRPAGKARLPLAMALLALVYLGLRLPALLALPLFNDEAVYLVRARFFPAMLAAPGVASATLPEGKLLHELALAALAPLPVDPLILARLLSVACGLATVLVLAAMGRALGRPWAGALAGLLYALSPLAGLHDVLGLPDSMLTLVSALLLWASLAFATRPAVGRRDALVVGALLGAASLVKLSGLFLFAIPVLAVLLLSATPAERWRRLGLLRVALIVALLGLACLAPFHYGSAERHKLGTEEARSVVMRQHAGAVGDWLLRYLPGPLLLAPVLALALYGVRRTALAAPRNPVPARQAVNRAGSARGVPLLPASQEEGPLGDRQAPSAVASAIAWQGAPALRAVEAADGGGNATPGAARLTGFLLVAGLAVIASFVLIGTTLYSRYLLPAWPPLLLAAALGTTALWSSGRAPRAAALLALGAAGGWGLVWLGWFATAPLTAPLARQDRAQYLETWSAGHHLEALLADVRATATAYGRLTLVNHNQPRLVHLATLLYLGDVPAIRLAEVDLSAPDAPARLADLARKEPLLLVVDQQEADVFALNQRFPRLRLLQRYPHPGGEMAFLLFEQEP